MEDAMNRPEGWRAPGSGIGKGFPHGRHKRDARRERAVARAEAKAPKKPAK